jgi:hypothetical protein
MDSYADPIFYPLESNKVLIPFSGTFPRFPEEMVGPVLKPVPLAAGMNCPSSCGPEHKNDSNGIVFHFDTILAA